MRCIVVGDDLPGVPPHQKRGAEDVDPYKDNIVAPIVGDDLPGVPPQKKRTLYIKALYLPNIIHRKTNA